MSEATCELNETAGQIIRIMRVGKGIGLRELAATLNVSAVLLGEIERGKRQHVADDLARRLIEALGLQYRNLVMTSADRRWRRRERHKLETARSRIDAVLDSHQWGRYPRVVEYGPEVVRIAGEDQGGYPVQMLEVRGRNAPVAALAAVRALVELPTCEAEKHEPIKRTLAAMGQVLAMLIARATRSTGPRHEACEECMHADCVADEQVIGDVDFCPSCDRHTLVVREGKGPGCSELCIYHGDEDA